jgi:hypothetical protein
MMMNPKTQRTIVIGLVLLVGLAMVLTMIVAPS